MMAGFGTESGTDDKENDTAESQRTAGDLPAVQDDGLCGELVFQGGDLLFGFNERIRSFGKETCVNRGKGPKQADEEDEVFHG